MKSTPSLVNEASGALPRGAPGRVFFLGWLMHEHHTLLQQNSKCLIAHSLHDLQLVPGPHTSVGVFLSRAMNRDAIRELTQGSTLELVEFNHYATHPKSCS